MLPTIIFTPFDYTIYSGSAGRNGKNPNVKVIAANVGDILLSNLQQPQTTQQKTMQGRLEPDLPSSVINY
jgi:hypothetical protein